MYWLPAIPVLLYFLLLLKIYRSLHRIIAFKVSNNPEIFVSIVVACRNEQNNIPPLLNNLSLQDYPEDLYEVIVVDDNSKDRTYEAAASFVGIRNLVTLKNNGSGKKKALRSGITASSGDLIITTDADCRMDKRWIRTIAAFYEKYNPDLIICPVQLEPGHGLFRKFQELEFLSLQGITAGTAFSGESVMCNGANLAFTRKAYLEHSDNLHDEIASGDDIFLLHSLKLNRKSRILWLESYDVVVHTAGSPTIGSFLKQRRRWISKGRAYNDRFTILVGIVAFLTNVLQIFVLVAAFYNKEFIWTLLTIFIIKSIPDFLILRNTSVRYGRKDLMKWFLPVSIIYPIYILSIFCYSILPTKKPEY